MFMQDCYLIHHLNTNCVNYFNIFYNYLEINYVLKRGLLIFATSVFAWLFAPPTPITIFI